VIKNGAISVALSLHSHAIASATQPAGTGAKSTDVILPGYEINTIAVEHDTAQRPRPLPVFPQKTPFRRRSFESGDLQYISLL
jgi:hypothetical protein